MHSGRAKGKEYLSTRLSYEEKETCRTFYFHEKLGQTILLFDGVRCQIMPNIFFALSEVARAISSNETPFISAICSATNLT
jgi:hypothetical protein